ncbi:MAG TPA: GPP34 family phosphoprotein [Anaerolineaceae bacterium]|nr:GPP34 family phosphoprotein [Anaerolineaceae bacterium]
MFTIFETLFLLAIDDEEGDVIDSAVSVLEPALAGSVLAELVLLNRIKLEDGRITITDQAPTEDRILDKTLSAIQEAGRLRKLKYWINTLTYEKLLSEIGQSLVEKGVLVRKKKRLLLVVPYGEGSARQISVKYGLKNHLREIVLGGQAADQREFVQLALLNECDLLSLVFTRGERKGAQKKIDTLIEGPGLSVGLGNALNEIIAVATRDAKK